jgi:hypothetical protein
LARIPFLSTSNCALIPRIMNFSSTAMCSFLHSGLCALKARVPRIAASHFGHTCRTGERGGLVCAARRMRAALVAFICPFLQHVQWGALAYRDAMGLPKRRTARNRNIRTRCICLRLQVERIRSIQNLVSHKRMDDQVQPQRFSFQKSASISVYTHYAMCQRGGY